MTITTKRLSTVLICIPPITNMSDVSTCLLTFRISFFGNYCYPWPIFAVVFLLFASVLYFLVANALSVLDIANMFSFS